jgi:hypothetical protein
LRAAIIQEFRVMLMLNKKDIVERTRKEPKKDSLTNRLWDVLKIIEYTWRKVKDPDVKAERYEKVMTLLSELETIILETIEDIESKQLSPEVKETVSDITETLLDCNNKYLEAIGFMVDFMENEKEDTLEKAGMAINKGESLVHTVVRKKIDLEIVPLEFGVA